MSGSGWTSVLCLYDTHSKDGGWNRFEILVGASSRDIRPKARIHVEADDGADPKTWDKERCCRPIIIRSRAGIFRKASLMSFTGNPVVHHGPPEGDIYQ